MDVQLYLDGFGTGCSWLSFLHRFPLDVVKIDREFMRVMQQNKDYSGVVQTVAQLAHDLKMEVIVEEVESSDDLTQLIELGTNHVQGYYFSKPLDAQTAKVLLVLSPC